MEQNYSQQKIEKITASFGIALRQTKEESIKWDKIRIRRTIDEKDFRPVDRYTSDKFSYVFEVIHIPFSDSIYSLNGVELTGICRGYKLENAIKAHNEYDNRYVPVKDEAISTKTKKTRKKPKKEDMITLPSNLLGDYDGFSKPKKSKKGKIEFDYSQKPYYLKTMETAQNRENRKIHYEDFLVRRGVFRCVNKDHKLKDINAVIRFANMSGDIPREFEKTFHAGYCKDCDTYFIMESTYQTIQDTGIPICRITDEKSYLSGEYLNNNGLAKQSILMDYGYNVNQMKGLSSIKRKRILSLLIEKKILTKSEIISYLDFFINQRKSLPQYEIAISKWEEDRDFVSGIGEKTPECVIVRSIKRKTAK